MPVAQIHALDFLLIEWARAAASEHGYLIATLINRAIAIDALRNSEHRTTRVVSRNQLGIGRGLNPEKLGLSVGENN